MASISLKTEPNYEPLYTDISIFGSTQYLAKIKQQYKNNFQSLAMDWRKNEMEAWAAEEWRWELVSRESYTFQILDGSTVKFGEVIHKFTPASHLLFYWWLKDIEDSEDGQEFVLAIKTLCSTESKKTTNNQSIQWLRTFFHTHNPPYE